MHTHRFDGDKSPAESGDESPHSINSGFAHWVHSCAFAIKHLV